MRKKDKKQVIGEEIGDEKIRLFLEVEPADATPPALHKLVKAYRGLRVDDFERFVGFFVEAGYDLSTQDAQGRDFVALIQDQRLAEPYIEIVRAAQR
ncbi:PA4642 family protein [Azotobacter salinestris]|uniref:PA4642 family protein n=1 Tax=Azotobacter salinestris TaxID=69964 RepID=UPI0012669B24|nr:PA4642 family protein [Azotobacter salinestris]